jgi:hypothetical protein
VELAALLAQYDADPRITLAGPIGGLIIVALAVTTILLIRNMNARIRRLPDRFPDRVSEQDEPPRDRDQAT